MINPDDRVTSEENEAARDIDAEFAAALAGGADPPPPSKARRPSKPSAEQAKAEDRRTNDCWGGWHYPNGCTAASYVCNCSCHNRSFSATAYDTNDEGLCVALTDMAHAMYALADATDRAAGLKRPGRS